MARERKRRSKTWMWFAGGAAVGLGGYLLMRYPVEAVGTVSETHLRALGARRYEVPWRDGILTYYLVGHGTEPMVLLHGLGDRPATWARVVAPLRDRYRICLPVQPGHPGTDLPMPYSFAYATDALSAAVTAAFGEAPIHLVGYSLGGWIGALFAAERSDRLQTLTLINPAGMPGGTNHSMLAPQTNVAARRTLTGLIGPLARWLPETAVDGFRLGIAGAVDSEVIATANQTPPPTGALGRITTPTRVIVGQADRLVPPSSSRQFADGIPGASLHIVSGGTHLIQTTHAGVVARLLQDFAQPDLLVSSS